MPHSHHAHASDAGSSDDRPVTIDDLMAELRNKGQRATTARRAVLAQLLAAGDTHLPVEELARRLGEEHPEIHLSTIYRTLDALESAGLIVHARFDEHSATYHLADDEHHHAVCTRCGRTLSLPPELFEPLDAQLLAQFDFHADPHHLTITGLCGDCTRE
jgi:Fur family transcriptional regulator, ferric uptake regulator